MIDLEARVRGHLRQRSDDLSLAPGDLGSVVARGRVVRRRRRHALVAVAATVAVIGALTVPIIRAIDGDDHATTVTADATGGAATLRPLAVPRDAASIDHHHLVGDAGGTVLLGRAHDGTPGLWRLEEGGDWTREAVGADAGDIFTGYVEADGWRVVWGYDTGPGPTPGIGPATAWVSHDEGPWLASRLAGAEGPDDGEWRGFIGPDGPVIAGFASPPRPDGPGGDDDAVHAILLALADRGITRVGVNLLRRVDGAVWVTANAGVENVFEGTLQDLGLDPKIVPEPTYGAPTTWHTSEGRTWTASTIDTADVGGGTFGPLVDVADGLGVQVTATDGATRLWLSGDGRTWKVADLGAPGNATYVSAVAGQGDRRLAIGSRDGRPAAWRSTDGGRGWTPVALPDLDRGVGLVSVTDGSRGSAIAAALVRNVTRRVDFNAMAMGFRLDQALLLTSDGDGAFRLQRVPVPARVDERFSMPAVLGGGDRAVYAVAGPQVTALWSIEGR